jgi:hypothetical protein
LPSKFDCIKWTQTAAAAFTPFNKTLSQTGADFFQKAYTENLPTVMTLKDIECHNEMPNTVPGKLCLQNLIELNEHKRQQQLLHPLTKTCTKQCWFISKRHIPKICITVMTLKDVQHPNEILNTVHIKLCLQNLIDVNEHSTTAAAFTPFNKTLSQTVLISFKKLTQKICQM